MHDWLHRCVNTDGATEQEVKTAAESGKRYTGIPLTNLATFVQSEKWYQNESCQNI